MVGEDLVVVQGTVFGSARMWLTDGLTSWAPDDVGNVEALRLSSTARIPATSTGSHRGFAFPLPHLRPVSVGSHLEVARMSRAAKITLGVSILSSAFIIWGVHHLQVTEREVCAASQRFSSRKV